MSGTPEATRLRITRAARLENLPALLDAAERACERAGTSATDRDAVRLAVEEVSVNIITYGYVDGTPGPITLTFAWDPTQMTIEIEDRARSFSPDTIGAPDLESDWERREPGGLGWHLVRQMVDLVRYRPNRGRGNHVTLVKQIR